MTMPYEVNLKVVGATDDEVIGRIKYWDPLIGEQTVTIISPDFASLCDEVQIWLKKKEVDCGKKCF